MAYSDRNRDENRAVAVIAVTALEVGLVIAVVHGLTVTFMDPPEVLPTTSASNVPLPRTSPSDKPDQSAKADQASKSDSRVTVADSGLTKQQDDEVIAFDNTGGAGSLGGQTILPRDPPPAFEPRPARPRNAPGLWVGEADYPRSDLHLGHQGRAVYRLEISSDGRVTGCTIVTSSGYPGLDAATCRKVSQRAQFAAATDSSGARVAGTYTGSVRWVIPE